MSGCLPTYLTQIPGLLPLSLPPFSLSALSVISPLSLSGFSFAFSFISPLNIIYHSLVFPFTLSIISPPSSRSSSILPILFNHCHPCPSPRNIFTEPHCPLNHTMSSFVPLVPRHPFLFLLISPPLLPLAVPRHSCCFSCPFAHLSFYCFPIFFAPFSLSIFSLFTSSVNSFFFSNNHALLAIIQTFSLLYTAYFPSFSSFPLEVGLASPFLFGQLS